MKYCPQCQTTYTDDTLRFCLQDGTPLADVSETSSRLPTVSFTDDETLVSPRKVEPLRVPVENQPNWEQSRETKISAIPAQPKKSRVALAVFLTAFVMLLLFGGAIGAWFYLKNNRKETAQATNSKVVTNQNPKNENKTETSPSPTESPKELLPSPSPTPTAAPSPDFNPKIVENEVSEKIHDWASATETLDMASLGSYYANQVDYYNKKGVSAAYVQNDKNRAFNKYDDLEINISNMRVTPNTTGDEATAVFDKEWDFQGAESPSSGKVQSQLQFKKINGKWLITSEKDLKVYYVNR